MPKILDSAVQLLWGQGTILLTLLCGAYFTIFTGFLPLTKFSVVIKKTVGSLFCRRKKGEGVSPFAAVSTALGGTMGVGNIVGVGAALGIGGAGCIFWMWVGAFLGMMTKYAEVFLAVKYREEDRASQSFRGGPMYYIAKGIPGGFGRALAVFFCFFCMVSSFSCGSMTQTNSIAESLAEGFSLPSGVCAVALTLLCAVVISGGSRRAAALCSALVPFMSLFYLAGCGVILFRFKENIPQALRDIIFCAFLPENALLGGGIGYMTALRVGISRGIFTHEAGLGSASIAHACSNTKSPVEQGFWGIFEVFCDTILICTVTALAILASGVPLSPSSAQKAFAMVMGFSGGRMLSVAITLFAFASIISFCLYGQRCVEYLFPNSRRAVPVYRLLFLIGCAAGCFGRPNVVFAMSDLMNACLLVPNLMALVILSPQVFKGTKDYFAADKYKEERNYVRLLNKAS